MADIWMDGGDAMRVGRWRGETSGGVFENIGRWIQVARERRRLRRLDPHILRDIGLEREAAMEEADRAFWDVPAGRR